MFWDVKKEVPECLFIFSRPKLSLGTYHSAGGKRSRGTGVAGLTGLQADIQLTLSIASPASHSILGAIHPKSLWSSKVDVRSPCSSHISRCHGLSGASSTPFHLPTHCFQLSIFGNAQGSCSLSGPPCVISAALGFYPFFGWISGGRHKHESLPIIWNQIFIMIPCTIFPSRLFSGHKFPVYIHIILI